MKVTVTISQARRFLLTKLLLYTPQSLSDRAGIENVFDTLRIIQYDPLNPCGRNVDLVLQARIKNYHPDQYYHWLYKEKKGIECYDKELCIVPIEDFALTNIRRDMAGSRMETKTFLRTYEREIELLLKQIELKGQITSSDVEDETRVLNNWGTDSRFGRVALDTLWKIGRLVVVKREKGKKYYGLPHMHYSSLVVEKSSNNLPTREHIKRRLRSVGLLPLSGGGGGWQGLGAVRKIIRDLVEDGEFIEVSIKGCPRVYVVAKSDEKRITDTVGTQKRKKIVLIAPLDNILWDRQMIYELFNFHYRWEVYAPIAKRKYGYYVLPILYGDAFIGRIEPVLSKEKQLIIKGFWQEDKKAWNKQVWNAFDKGIEAFRKYLNATEIIHKPSP